MEIKRKGNSKRAGWISSLGVKKSNQLTLNTSEVIDENMRISNADTYYNVYTLFDGFTDNTC